MAETKQETAVARYNPNLPAKSQGTLKGFLGSPNVMSALAEVARDKLTPQKIAKMVLIASNRNPAILDCTMTSILEATIASAELGLDCSGGLGRAYLVPYKNKATFIIGYLGLMELAYRSERVESIQAEVVYKQDYFKYEKGLKNTIDHIENDDHDELDEDIIGAYTICRFKGGGYHIHYMKRRRIEKIRTENAKTDKFWSKYYVAMCKKTVIRAASKFWPLSVDTQMDIARLGDEEYSDTIAPAVTLQQTDGRQKWGFDQQQADESGEQTESPIIDVPADTGPVEVSDEDRKLLMTSLTAKLAKGGVKKQSEIDLHIADMCKAVNAADVNGIVNLDQYHGALNWIEEGL